MVTKNGADSEAIFGMADTETPELGSSVNKALNDEELKAVRKCAYRGQPYGHNGWTQSEARSMSAESTMRPQGRPKKLSTTQKLNKET